MKAKIIFVLFGAILMVSFFGTEIFGAKTNNEGATVEANIDLNPGVINLKNQGKFVIVTATCWKESFARRVQKHTVWVLPVTQLRAYAKSLTRQSNTISLLLLAGFLLAILIWSRIL